MTSDMIRKYSLQLIMSSFFFSCISDKYC
jgi:hypothetical protein